MELDNVLVACNYHRSVYRALWSFILILLLTHHSPSNTSTAYISCDITLCATYWSKSIIRMSVILFHCFFRAAVLPLFLVKYEFEPMIDVDAILS
jgi:hypothetical protein